MGYHRNVDNLFGNEVNPNVFRLDDEFNSPTINLENPDPDCDLDYIPNESRNLEVNIAMSNNSGFGGHNASLVFKRV